MRSSGGQALLMFYTDASSYPRAWQGVRGPRSGKLRRVPLLRGGECRRCESVQVEHGSATTTWRACRTAECEALEDKLPLHRRLELPTSLAGCTGSPKREAPKGSLTARRRVFVVDGSSCRRCESVQVEHGSATTTWRACRTAECGVRGPRSGKLRRVPLLRGGECKPVKGWRKHEQSLGPAVEGASRCKSSMGRRRRHGELAGLLNAKLWRNTDASSYPRAWQGVRGPRSGKLRRVPLLRGGECKPVKASV
jgi:hypothetical protein